MGWNIILRPGRKQKGIFTAEDAESAETAKTILSSASSALSAVEISTAKTP
jgi:hypothetical protein